MFRSLRLQSLQSILVCCLLCAAVICSAEENTWESWLHKVLDSIRSPNLPAANKFRVQAMPLQQEHPLLCTPGLPQFGKREFIEYIPGCGPIILTSPHGGELKPEDIPDRTYGSTVADSYTQEVTRQLARNIEEYTSSGFAPHVIINRLARIKLDANREIVEAAQGDPQAEQAWYEYHAFIDQAKATVTASYGQGLYIDLHGHGHQEQWIEFGYLLTAEQLDLLSDAQISESNIVDQVSLRYRAQLLSRTRNLPFSELLRGNSSLGGLLQRKYKSVPSPTFKGPNGGNYFTGGYNTQRHGSVDGGVIDGLQIEMSQNVRFEEAARITFVQYLATCILEYYNLFWNSTMNKNT